MEEDKADYKSVPLAENPLNRMFLVRGVQIQSDYAGPLILEGYLMKMNSGNYLFGAYEYQKRYFYLSVNEGIFKFTKT